MPTINITNKPDGGILVETYPPLAFLIAAGLKPGEVSPADTAALSALVVLTTAPGVEVANAPVTEEPEPVKAPAAAGGDLEFMRLLGTISERAREMGADDFAVSFGACDCEPGSMSISVQWQVDGNHCRTDRHFTAKELNSTKLGAVELLDLKSLIPALQKTVEKVRDEKAEKPAKPIPTSLH